MTLVHRQMTLTERTTHHSTSQDNNEGVPFPSSGFGEDLGPGVQYDPSSGPGLTRPSSIQPVSATSAPMEYGFDRENYHWLRGVVRFDRQSQVWVVEYSLAARDRFGGRLALVAAQGVLDGLREGDMVDIHGHVDMDRTDRQGLPVYHVRNESTNSDVIHSVDVRS